MDRKYRCHIDYRYRCEENTNMISILIFANIAIPTHCRNSTTGIIHGLLTLKILANSILLIYYRCLVLGSLTRSHYVKFCLLKKKKKKKKKWQVEFKSLK